MSVLVGFGGKIEGDSWFTWRFFVIYQGNPSMSPKRTPMPGVLWMVATSASRAAASSDSDTLVSGRSTVDTPSSPSNWCPLTVSFSRGGQAPTKIDYRKKVGTLILPSPLEDLDTPSNVLVSSHGFINCGCEKRISRCHSQYGPRTPHAATLTSTAPDKGSLQ